MSLHRYLYAASDPVNKVDPSGEFFSIASTLSVMSLTAIIVSLAIPSYAVVIIYELYVSGERSVAGCNDFKMILKKNNKDVAGYDSFIVGRDTVSYDEPYVGIGLISKRIPSRASKRTSLGAEQSNISNGGNKAIHTGRDTHRHITEGCVRMEVDDFNKLFAYLEAQKDTKIDKWGWFKNVYVNAQAISTTPSPKCRVPAKGDNQ